MIAALIISAFVWFGIGYSIGVWCVRRKTEDLEMENFVLTVELMEERREVKL